MAKQNPSKRSQSLKRSHNVRTGAPGTERPLHVFAPMPQNLTERPAPRPLDDADARRAQIRAIAAGLVDGPRMGRRFHVPAGVALEPSQRRRQHGSRPRAAAPESRAHRPLVRRLLDAGLLVAQVGALAALLTVSSGEVSEGGTSFPPRAPPISGVSSGEVNSPPLTRLRGITSEGGTSFPPRAPPISGVSSGGLSEGGTSFPPRAPPMKRCQLRRSKRRGNLRSPLVHPPSAVSAPAK